MDIYENMTKMLQQDFGMPQEQAEAMSGLCKILDCQEYVRSHE